MPQRALLSAALLASFLSLSAQAQTPALILRDVVLVGSNWDGTAEVFDPHTFKVLKRIDIVPDRAERMAAIADEGLVRRGLFYGIRHLIGQGNDQLVDDLFPSKDGRFIYASRPSFADVVAQIVPVHARDLTGLAADAFGGVDQLGHRLLIPHRRRHGCGGRAGNDVLAGHSKILH